MEAVRSFETSGTACQKKYSLASQNIWIAAVEILVLARKKNLTNCRTVLYVIFCKTYISKSHSPCNPNSTSAYSSPHFHSWVHLNILTFIEPTEHCCCSKLGHDKVLHYARFGNNFSLHKNTLVLISIIRFIVIFILSPQNAH